MTHQCNIEHAPDITIRPGTIDDLPDCVEALCASELGRVYFPDAHHAQEFLAAGLERAVLYVACADTACLGYIWLAPHGAFCRFPYIRNLAVKEAYRGRGIGRTLLAFAESLAFRQAPRLFLLVSSFNARAKKLYQSLGYVEAGVIPDLFMEGIAEHLMYKSAWQSCCDEGETRAPGDCEHPMTCAKVTRRC